MVVELCRSPSMGVSEGTDYLDPNQGRLKLGSSHEYQRRGAARPVLLPLLRESFRGVQALSGIRGRWKVLLLWRCKIVPGICERGNSLIRRMVRCCVASVFGWSSTGVGVCERNKPGRRVWWLTTVCGRRLLTPISDSIISGVEV